MARRCPHCGEMLTYLNYMEYFRGHAWGTVDERGNMSEEDYERDDANIDRYECPECDEVISVDDMPEAWLNDTSDNESEPQIIDLNLWSNAQ